MPRPKTEHPTPAELEILKILWERGPGTVREVLDALPASRQRAYTSVMSLLNVMSDKGLLARQAQGRAFLYRPRVARERAVGRMVDDLLGRAFEGSASALVAHLLDRSKVSEEELDEIRKTIDEFERGGGA